MLGLGTRLFISPESSYGIEAQNNYTNGASASPYDPVHTYYIKNNRPSTSFDYGQVEFLSNSVSKNNVLHKNISHVEGNFTFNLDSRMTKLFSILTHYPILITNYAIENTLTTEVIEIQTIPVNSNVSNFSQETPEVYGSDYVVSKKLLNDVKSSSIIQTLSGKEINSETIDFYKFLGMCPTNYQISINQDSTIEIDVNYIGQKEVLMSDDFSGNDIQDVYSDVYASWQTTLKMDFGLGEVIMPFSDFTLEVNSNLEFAPFINNTLFNENKPFSGLKEVTGSFTVEYKDDSYYNMIKDIDNASMKLEITNGTSWFHIIMPTINFIDGGSLNQIPTGGLELNLSFLSKSNITSNYINETGNWEVENPLAETTTYNLPYESDIILKIKE